MDDHELQKQQKRERKLEKRQEKYRRRASAYYVRLGAVLLLLIPLIFLSIWITVSPSDKTTSSISGRAVEVLRYGGGKGRASIYIRLDNGFQYKLPTSVVSQYEGGLQGLEDKLEGQYVELRINDRKLVYNKAVQVKVNGDVIIGYDAFADIYREARTWSIVLSVVLVLGIELYLLCTYTRPKR